MEPSLPGAIPSSYLIQPALYMHPRQTRPCWRCPASRSSAPRPRASLAKAPRRAARGSAWMARGGAWAPVLLPLVAVVAVRAPAPATWAVAPVEVGATAPALAPRGERAGPPDRRHPSAFRAAPSRSARHRRPAGDRPGGAPSKRPATKGRRARRRIHMFQAACRARETTVSLPDAPANAPRRWAGFALSIGRAAQLPAARRANPCGPDLARQTNTYRRSTAALRCSLGHTREGPARARRRGSSRELVRRPPACIMAHPARSGGSTRGAARARRGGGARAPRREVAARCAPDFEELVRVPRVLQLDAARERHTRTQLASLLQEEALVRH